MERNYPTLAYQFYKKSLFDRKIKQNDLLLQLYLGYKELENESESSKRTSYIQQEFELGFESIQRQEIISHLEKLSILAQILNLEEKSTKERCLRTPNSVKKRLRDYRLWINKAIRYQ